MNKIILVVWGICLFLLIYILGNKSNRKQFVKYFEDNIEKTIHNKKNNCDKKFPLYQLIIYYMYIIIMFAILIIVPIFIQVILVDIKESLYVPKDIIVVYYSGVEILLYFAGTIMLIPIIMVIDLIINRGFLLEIDREKVRFNAKDGGWLINITMSLFVIVLSVPLLFFGLNHYRYCTEDKIVIKTVFSKEKTYNYEDIKYVVRHEYNVDAAATVEEYNERFDYKVYFNDGKSYKISDLTIFEKEIISKKNIRMEIDD